MPLPTREDFGGGPDAESAWEDFGGKTVDEVYDLFCPDFHLEHFMWMGEIAFKFYFPVIARWVHGLRPVEEDDFRPSVDLLGHCIQMHFDCHEDMTGMHDRIISLCDHVCARLDHYTHDENERDEIRATWTDLRRQVADDAIGIRRPRL